MNASTTPPDPRERPRWQRRAAGVLVLGCLGYGVAATFGGYTPAAQIDGWLVDQLGEPELTYTLILTWFTLLLPGALLLTGFAILVGGRPAARREAQQLRESNESARRYLKDKFKFKFNRK